MHRRGPPPLADSRSLRTQSGRRTRKAATLSILILHTKNLSRRRHLARTRAFSAARGERAILVMKDPTWEQEYVDRVVVADTTSIDETLRAVQAVVDSEKEPVRAVVTFAERSIPAVARVCARLGLPSISEETAYLARDKYAMRTAVAGPGAVTQPAFGLATDLEAARREADRIGYPLVLKPFIGTGSMFVRSVENDRELEEHFETFRRGAWEGFTIDPLHDAAHTQYAGALLMEEFVGGPEISVESLVVDGRTITLGIHDKPLPTGPTFEEVYACTPTRLPADVVAQVEAATAAVHGALNITTGATHVEFRLRNGREPVLLEAAARMGGGPIYRSVQLSTDIDLVDAVLHLAYGEDPDVAPPMAATPVGFWNIFPDEAGTLTEVEGVDAATRDPRVHEIEIYKQPGDFLQVPPRTFQGHGHVVFSADRTDQLDEVFAELVATIRLRTKIDSLDGSRS